MISIKTPFVLGGTRLYAGPGNIVYGLSSYEQQLLKINLATQSITSTAMPSQVNLSKLAISGDNVYALSDTQNNGTKLRALPGNTFVDVSGDNNPINVAVSASNQFYFMYADKIVRFPVLGQPEKTTFAFTYPSLFRPYELLTDGSKLYVVGFNNNTWSIAEIKLSESSSANTATTLSINAPPEEVIQFAVSKGIIYMNTGSMFNTEKGVFSTYACHNGFVLKTDFVAVTADYVVRSTGYQSLMQVFPLSTIDCSLYDLKKTLVGTVYREPAYPAGTSPYDDGTVVTQSCALPTDYSKWQWNRENAGEQWNDGGVAFAVLKPGSVVPLNRGGPEGGGISALAASNKAFVIPAASLVYAREYAKNLSGLNPQINVPAYQHKTNVTFKANTTGPESVFAYPEPVPTCQLAWDATQWMQGTGSEPVPVPVPAAARFGMGHGKDDDGGCAYGLSGDYNPQPLLYYADADTCAPPREVGHPGRCIQQIDGTPRVFYPGSAVDLDRAMFGCAWNNDDIFFT